jgi:spore maturation protein CgeB
MSAVDPAFHKRWSLTPEDLARYSCDVCFVGTLVPSHLYRRRIAALEALRDFDLAIWSIHEVPPSLRGPYRGEALGAEMIKAMSGSKIVVNPHGDFMPFGGNLRLFEACGAGALQLTDDLPAVRRWFTVGEHIEAFDGPDHLAKRVAYYLSHEAERLRIALAGQAHVHASHTYDERMSRLMNMVEALRDV